MFFKELTIQEYFNTVTDHVDTFLSRADAYNGTNATIKGAALGWPSGLIKVFSRDYNTYLNL